MLLVSTDMRWTVGGHTIIHVLDEVPEVASDHDHPEGKGGFDCVSDLLVLSKPAEKGRG